MGSMALWQLARRGIKAVGFEQFTIAHDRGATGGETRIFRTAYAEGSEYVSLLRQSLELWRQLEQETGAKLLDLNGFATVGTPDQEVVRSVRLSIDEYGLDARIYDHAEAAKAMPGLNVRPGEIAVVDAAGGLLKPEYSVLTAARHAEALGAGLFDRTEVLDISPDPDGVWVRTARGQYRVRRLIVSAGAWIERFLPGHLQVKPHRVVLAWFVARKPEFFLPAAFPPMGRQVEGTPISLFSSQDGLTVKAAINGSVGEVADPLDVKASLAPEIDRLSAILKEYCPQLSPEPIRISSYVDGFSPDGHAFVGALADMPSVIVAGGFSAHGFKMATGIGAALADLATNGKTDGPIDHLSVDRLR
jgi:sarcosine oxidase